MALGKGEITKNWQLTSLHLFWSKHVFFSYLNTFDHNPPSYLLICFCRGKQGIDILRIHTKVVWYGIVCKNSTKNNGVINNETSGCAVFYGHFAFKAQYLIHYTCDITMASPQWMSLIDYNLIAFSSMSTECKCSMLEIRIKTVNVKVSPYEGVPVLDWVLNIGSCN